MVEANFLAYQEGLEELSGEVFNIAFGKRVSIKDLVNSINKLLNTAITPQYVDLRPGDVKHSLANIGKERQFLGYEPKIDFHEGLKKLMLQ